MTVALGRWAGHSWCAAVCSSRRRGRQRLAAGAGASRCYHTFRARGPRSPSIYLEGVHAYGAADRPLLPLQAGWQRSAAQRAGHAAVAHCEHPDHRVRQEAEACRPAEPSSKFDRSQVPVWAPAAARLVRATVTRRGQHAATTRWHQPCMERSSLLRGLWRSLIIKPTDIAHGKLRPILIPRRLRLTAIAQGATPAQAALQTRSHHSPSDPASRDLRSSRHPCPPFRRRCRRPPPSKALPCISGGPSPDMSLDGSMRGGKRPGCPSSLSSLEGSMRGGMRRSYQSVRALFEEPAEGGAAGAAAAPPPPPAAQASPRPCQQPPLALLQRLSSRAPPLERSSLQVRAHALCGGMPSMHCATPGCRCYGLRGPTAWQGSPLLAKS